MKYLVIFALVISIVLVGCTSPNKTNTAEIDALMNNQQVAWNKGDIDGFMDPYWNSDSLLFIGKRGITNGWNQTLQNYKNSYPDKAAMGRLEFQIVKHDQLGDQGVFTIGKWTLYRSSDTLGGHFTLLWKMKDGNWKIVTDHSS